MRSSRVRRRLCGAAVAVCAAVGRVTTWRVSLMVLAMVVHASPARADAEAWGWYDHQVRIHAPERGPQLSVRAMTDLRANARSGGLDMLFLRVGPIVSVAPWLSLAAHFTTVADKGDDGVFGPQYRPEFDAVLVARFDDLIVSDRNRLEGIFGAPEPVFRYRNLVRLDYRPWVSLGFFAFEEILLRNQPQTFHENRASVGLRVPAGSQASLEAGYMLRSRLTSSGLWEQDHTALVSIVVQTDLTRGETPAETPSRETTDGPDE